MNRSMTFVIPEDLKKQINIFCAKEDINKTEFFINTVSNYLDVDKSKFYEEKKINENELIKKTIMRCCNNKFEKLGTIKNRLRNKKIDGDLELKILNIARSMDNVIINTRVHKVNKMNFYSIKWNTKWKK